jgi:hypothetical protein
MKHILTIIATAAAAMSFANFSFNAETPREVSDVKLGWASDFKHSHATLSSDLFRSTRFSTGPALSYRFETPTTSDQLYAGWRVSYDLLSTRNTSFTVDLTMKGWRFDSQMNPFNERNPVLVGASFGVRF